MTDRGYWSKRMPARISRRRALASGLSLTAGAATWAACGGGDGTPPADAGPRRGGTLRTGTTAAFSGLDPQTETGTGLAITARLYGYLLHVDPRDDSIIYDQAAQVEQPDATTFVFKLRPGIEFHDVEPVHGRTLSAEDVVASIERFRRNPIATTKTFHTTVLDRVEAMDELTVRVTTKRPYAYSLAYLGDISAGAILAKELIEQEVSLYTAAAGSGPFQLEQAQPPGRARIVRNDGYYRGPVPYLDAMEWEVFTEGTSLNAAMLDGAIDSIPAGAQQDARTLAAEREEIEVTAEPSLSWLALGTRMDVPPLHDPRVRGAIDLALDRDAMIRDIAGGDGRILGPVNPHLAEGYWALFENDVREAFGGSATMDERRSAARQLLMAAGAERAAFTLQVANLAPMLDVAGVVKEQLLEIGIAVEVQPQDLLVWFTNFRRGAFQLTLVSQPPYETADIPLRFFHSRGPDGSGSPFAFADGTTDSLIERSWGELEREQRRKTVQEAQKLMIFQRPMMELFTSVGYSAAWSRVRNRRPGLPGSLAQYNYEQWIAE
ncbi:MAG TPA: ABC transporter substrate-binding protein [Dehalococcoidia bacterium]|nr:ABC transporter substrate-binding protein [Dehalococcoidia bacterium]